MDSEDSSFMSESSKKRDRRVWTDEEEDALLNIQEDLVTNGIQPNVHCITYPLYFQYHKDVGGWRGKPFPRYERLAHVFGVDRAIGKAAKVPPAIVEEVSQEPKNQDHANAFDSKLEGDHLSTAKSEEFTSKSKRRKREDDDKIVHGLDKFDATFKEVRQTSNEQIRLLVEYMQPKGNKKDEVRAKKDELWAELLKLNLSTTNQIKALKFLIADSAELFWLLTQRKKSRNLSCNLFVSHID
ncbi:hypothetical protein M0R45_016015 [Rubus argutus]|uniref:Myb-like domain-containing protein n=1 Tax=Rubus argutus TaxID=59490 RepID=A0AAW1XQV7_RUBAR